MVNIEKPSTNGIDIDRMFELVGDDQELKHYVTNLVIQNQELLNEVKRLSAEKDMLLDEVNIDELTKAYNRKILSKISKYDVVAMCDVDNFKSINDRFGHDGGDEVLVLISKVLRDEIRSNDFVIRLGGDEFALVLQNCNLETAMARLNTVKTKIADIMLLEDKTNVTISFGVSIYEEGKSFDAAIKEADMALYFSKERGRNRITAFKGNIENIQKKIV